MLYKEQCQKNNAKKQNNVVCTCGFVRTVARWHWWIYEEVHGRRLLRRQWRGCQTFEPPSPALSGPAAAACVPTMHGRWIRDEWNLPTLVAMSRIPRSPTAVPMPRCPLVCPLVCPLDCPLVSATCSGKCWSAATGIGYRRAWRWQWFPHLGFCPRCPMRRSVVLGSSVERGGFRW
jgi:hypothetical protein